MGEAAAELGGDIDVSLPEPPAGPTSAEGFLDYWRRAVQTQGARVALLQILDHLNVALEDGDLVLGAPGAFALGQLREAGNKELLQALMVRYFRGNAPGLRFKVAAEGPSQTGLKESIIQTPVFQELYAELGARILEVKPERK